MTIEAKHSFLLSPKYFAILSLVIVCFLDSFTPIYVKLCEQEISASATVFYRFFFGFLIFGLINSINSIDSIRDKKNNKEQQSVPIDSVFTKRKLLLLLLLLCAGVFATFNQICWALSLTQTSIGSSALLHSLSPIFTAVLAYVFLKAEIKLQLLVGMLISIGGSILISAGDFLISISQLQGDGFALLSSAFSAAYLNVVEQLRVHLNSSRILFWRCLLGTIFVLPFLLFNTERLIPVSTSGWLAIAGLTLTFAISYWLVTSSLAVLSSTLVTIILLLEPFLSSMQASIFFSEELSSLQWISFILVIFGVYLAITADNKALNE